tara:strand:+ start:340 stop:531 length:192 start_codon:yes stop_codon:yes gene_type:complete
MSIASQFRAKWDVLLEAADRTRGQGADARRTAIMKAADGADLMLITRADYAAVMKARHGSWPE